MTEPVRVGIFGSCVSRDTFRILSPERYVVKVYIARHSVVAMDTDASCRYEVDLGLSSEFQQRQVKTDAAGTLARRFTSWGKSLDLLLWDLVDERHGYVRFPEGTYVTRSVEMMDDPRRLAILNEGELIPFGTDRHFATWTLAADRFVDRLRTVGLLARTLLVAVPWAETMSDGSPSPLSMGVEARIANARYGRYYEHLAALGLPTLTCLQPQGDPRHRWGAAPFHYHRSVYETILTGIDAFLGVASDAR